MKVDEFKLKDDDAAIVVGKDMGLTMYLPNFPEDAVIDMTDHQNVYFTMALMMAMRDEEFNDFINAKMESMFAAMDKMEDSDDGCGPSCCPGCGGCGGE
jgi:hypothetical protein